MSEAVKLTVDDSSVATVTLDLPDKPVNVLTPRVLGQLDGCLSNLKGASGVVFTSAKKVFVAGADVNLFLTLSAAELKQFLKLGQEVFNRIESLAMPTVAAINGHCLGGGLELALACRYRVVADDANIKIGLPETKLGLIPAWGGTVRLPKLTGTQRAAELIISGQAIDPQRAGQLGVVDSVVPADQLLVEARKMLKAAPPRRYIVGDETIENHTTTAAQAKAVETLWIGVRDGAAAGLAAEYEAISALLQTRETRAAINAFFNR